MATRLRKLTPEEIGEIVPASVKQSMPDDPGFLGVRMDVNWFASNPESALQHLKAEGYHARQFGDGWNFAVQKMQRDENGSVMPPIPENWHIFDPDDPSDLGYDIMDMLGTVGVGALATIGFGLGGPMGAAVGGAVGELARQGIGAFKGMGAGNIDPMQVGMSAAFEGAAPLVGKGISKVGSAIMTKALPTLQDIGLGFGAKVAGLANTPALSGGEALSMRAATMGEAITLPSVTPGGMGLTLPKGEIPDPIDLVDLLRAKLDHVAAHGFAEATQAGAIRAANSNLHIPFGRSVGELLNSDMLLTTIDLEDARGASNLVNQLMHILQVPTSIRVQQRVTQGLAGGLPGFQTVRVPLPRAARIQMLLQTQPDIPTAHTILKHLDDYVSWKKGYDDVNKHFVSKFTSRVRAAAVELRTEIGNALGPNYRALNRITEVKTETRNFLRSKVGDGVDGAERFVAGLHQANRTEQRRALERFDRLFNTSFMPILKLTEAGRRFGPKGRPGTFPRFTAFGQPIGINLFAAAPVAMAGMAGGPVGLAAGMAAATPRGVVEITRAGQALTRGVMASGRGIGAAVSSRTGQVGAFSAVSEGAREFEQRYMAPGKPVLSADDTRPRKRLRLQ